MKLIYSQQGGVSVVAETENDVRELVEKYASSVKVSKAEKKRRRYQHTIICSQCNRKCRGNMGLAMHTIRAHSGKTWSTRGPKKKDNANR